MKSKTIILLTLVLFTTFIISCSTPAPPTKETDTDIPVDITEQEASTIPQTPAPQDDAATMKSFKTVAPENIPKCLTQVETVQKILEKTAAQVAEFGTTKYLFNDKDQVFLNSKPMTDNEGLSSPIPLFTSWDSSKIENLEQVESWVSGNSVVTIKGLRRADDGNWYNVSAGSGTLYEMEGWIHEIFLSSLTQTNPSYKGAGPPPGEGGGGRRGGGRRGGGGGG